MTKWGDNMYLKYLREKAGYTQQELADKAGVSRTTISMIEQGENQPSVKLAKKFGEIFNVGWEKFF